jgi:hypothetical protein
MRRVLMVVTSHGQIRGEPRTGHHEIAGTAFETPSRSVGRTVRWFRRQWRSEPMKIGILGVGNMGSTLGLLTEALAPARDPAPGSAAYP